MEKNLQIKTGYKSLFIAFTLCLSVLSCKKDNPEPISEDPNPVDEIVGKYDCKEYVWYIYNQGGGSGNPQIHNEVAEIRKASNGIDYNFYLDGNWEAELIFDRVYDGVLYCTVSDIHGCYNSNNNTLYDMSGWNSTLADYPASEVTFQTNKNNKLEACFRQYNLHDATTGVPNDYWIIIYYEGNRR